jgi:hypothetical protein
LSRASKTAEKPQPKQCGNALIEQREHPKKSRAPAKRQTLLFSLNMVALLCGSLESAS